MLMSEYKAGKEWEPYQESQIYFVKKGVVSDSWTFRVRMYLILALQSSLYALRC